MNKFMFLLVLTLILMRMLIKARSHQKNNEIVLEAVVNIPPKLWEWMVMILNLALRCATKLSFKDSLKLLKDIEASV